MKKPFIIVFGHEKGGTGKSTLCINVTLGLMYKSYNVAILDTDTRQATTYNFFKQRESQHNNVPCPSYDLAFSSSKDSKEYSKEDDITTIITFIAKNSHKDFIIIDTAGSYNNFTVHSLDFAHLVITPLSDSILDINALVFTNHNSLIRGPYAEVIFNQRKKRIIEKNIQQLYWYLIRNRVALIPQENTTKCIQILQHISKNIGAELLCEIKDRSVLKDIFILGLSVLDLPHLTQDISTTKLNTVNEIMYIVDKIINLSKIINFE